MIVLDKKRIQVYLLALAILFISIFIYTNNSNNGEYQTFIIFQFVINCIIWFYKMISSMKEHPYSLDTMLWVFYFFFFGLAGITQYLNNDYCWNAEFSDHTIIKANFILFVWTMVIVITQFIYTNKNVSMKRIKAEYELDTTLLALPFTIISFIFIVYRISNIGLINTLSRTTNESIEFSSNETLSMMINCIFQAISYFAAVLSILRYKEARDINSIILIIVNLILLIMGYFPTGIARYSVAVMYLGLLFIFDDRIKKTDNRIFDIIFVFAFLLILPLFNAWRFSQFGQVSPVKAIDNVFSNFSKGFLENDYDAFTELCLSVRYVEKFGIGRFQVLGILLFFIPRSIWTSKPYPSATIVSTVNGGSSFNNVSCSMPEEGYLDAGLVGVILFAIFIGILVKYIDNSYYRNFDQNKAYGKHPIEIIYPTLVIFFFFLSRGDMMYTYPYLVAYLIVWGMILLFSKKIIINNDSINGK